MTRKFTTVNYEASLKQTVTISDCLPPEHLARFIVGIIGIRKNYQQRTME